MVLILSGFFNKQDWPSEYVTISFDDGSNTIGIGMPYAGDFLFLPYEGTKDIEVTTSAANMTIEYLVIYEA